MEVLGINLSEGQLWLLGIAGVAGTNWLSFRLGLKQASHSRAVTASLAFRAAVNKARIDLPHLPDREGIRKGLGDFERAIQLANDNYRPYLRKQQLQAFDEVWGKLRHTTRIAGDVTFRRLSVVEMGELPTPNDQSKMRVILEDLAQQLSEFATEK